MSRSSDSFITAVAIGAGVAVMAGGVSGVAAVAAPRPAAAAPVNVDQVLDLARTQFGTTESPAGSNRTKYGVAYGRDGEPWCAIFVQWLFAQEGMSAALPSKTASVYELRDAFKRAGRFHSDPQVGDVVIYGFGAGHVGIVESVQDKTITAIEGNTSASDKGSQDNGGVVARKVRARNSQILGYGRPSYGANAATNFGVLSSPYNALFERAGAKYGVAPRLLASVAKNESSFNPKADNGIAQGLMQITPETAKSLGVDPFDPAQAIDGSARMLSGLTKELGSTELALSAYNAGPRDVKKCHCVLPATQNYVNNVIANERSAA